MVAGGLAYHVFDGIAEQGRGYGDVGYEAVVDGAFGQQSVGKKAEQGTVGVAANDVDGINQTGGIDSLEQQDEQHEDGTDGNMRALAETFVVLPFHDIDAVDGGQRGQRGVGTGERRRDDAEDKKGC